MVGHLASGERLHMQGACMAVIATPLAFPVSLCSDSAQAEVGRGWQLVLKRLF